MEEVRQLEPRLLERAPAVVPRLARHHPYRDVEVEEVREELVREHRVPTVRHERLARILVHVLVTCKKGKKKSEVSPGETEEALLKRALTGEEIPRAGACELCVHLDRVDEIAPCVRAVGEEVDERAVQDADAGLGRTPVGGDGAAPQVGHVEDGVQVREDEGDVAAVEREDLLEEAGIGDGDGQLGLVVGIPSRVEARHEQDGAQDS